MDGLFGKQNFRNEIVWCYKTGGVPTKKGSFSRKHDTIFFYAKGRNSFNRLLQISYSHTLPEPHTKSGKSLGMARDGVGKYREVHMRDWWVEYGVNKRDDVTPLYRNNKERVGYPTQKPLKLLDRIIEASSNEGDIVLDPFCGCGTTVQAAQNLNRQWIGIDICVNACKVIETRLRGHFDSVWDDVEFIGMPLTLDHAKTLADMDKFRFERWAAALVDGMEPNKKQRGDHGIDGYGRFAIRKGKFIDLVSQVKGGGTKPADVQAFNGARQQAKADLGIFTCFENRVTMGMKDAAASTGRFMEVPRVQIYTVDDFFAGRRRRLPMVA